MHTKNATFWVGWRNENKYRKYASWEYANGLRACLCSVYVCLAASAKFHVHLWRKRTTISSLQFHRQTIHTYIKHTKYPVIWGNVCNVYPVYVACFPFVYLSAIIWLAVFVDVHSFFLSHSREWCTLCQKYFKSVFYWWCTTPNVHSKMVFSIFPYHLTIYIHICTFFCW